jgi:hypothetical protein
MRADVEIMPEVMCGRHWWPDPKGASASLCPCVRAELIAAIQALQSRLERFDALLPKYQRTVSKVIELLQLRALDDVVPAVQRLVQAKT